MNFNELVKTAPVRTSMFGFKGLFSVELIITPVNEIRDAIDGATTEKFDTVFGRYDSALDNTRLRGYLATRVVGFKGLTLGVALALCGRKLPDSMKDKAKDPLPCQRETVETLLNAVVDFDKEVLSRLKTLAEEAAREERKAQGN